MMGRDQIEWAANKGMKADEAWAYRSFAAPRAIVICFGRGGAELNFGAEAKRSRKVRRAIRRFTKDVAIVPFDEASAERFAVVAAALAARGQPIGLYDTLVAAQYVADVAGERVQKFLPQ